MTSRDIQTVPITAPHSADCKREKLFLPPFREFFSRWKNNKENFHIKDIFRVESWKLFPTIRFPTAFFERHHKLEIKEKYPTVYW